MKKNFMVFASFLTLIFLQAKPAYATSDLGLMEKLAFSANELRALKACEESLRNDLKENLLQQQKLIELLDQHHLEELVTYEEDGLEWFADHESLGRRVVLVNNIYLGKLIDLQANIDGHSRASGNLRLKSFYNKEVIKIPYSDVRSIKVFVSANSRKRAVDEFSSLYSDWAVAPYSEHAPGGGAWMNQLLGFNYGHLIYGEADGIFNSGNVRQIDPFVSLRGKDLALLFFDLETGQYSIRKLLLPQLLRMIQQDGQQTKILEIRISPKPTEHPNQKLFDFFIGKP